MRAHLYPVSPHHRNYRTMSLGDVEAELADFTCLECGGRRSHLVFRVEARSHRVTLHIKCGLCGASTRLLDDQHHLEHVFHHADAPTAGKSTELSGQGMTRSNVQPGRVL
jgi:transcription elongation factor Elf1